ncbi:hypothetical protein [Spiroplasma litorale]|nr:hypothetical protein [Spiroplasma litorale]
MYKITIKAADNQNEIKNEGDFQFQRFRVNGIVEKCDLESLFNQTYKI